MNLELTDEQRLLAKQARDMLAARSSYDSMRAQIEAGQEWNEGLWRDFAELGFLGAGVSEAYGGLGLTKLDMGIISTEIGRANAGLPFFSSLSMMATAIEEFGAPELCERYLPGLASGETVGAFWAHNGCFGKRPTAPDLRLESGKLHGVATPLIDGGVADFAVVACRISDALGLAVVDLAQQEVRRVKLQGADLLHGVYEVTFSGANAQQLAASAELITAFVDKAAIQLAFESLGGAQACLEMAKAYVTDRKIFGRSLASYQAVKHKLADCFVKIEYARSNLYYAAWVADHSMLALPAAASTSQLLARDAFQQSARENLQLHGGIGYTYEANCHFYYRRERFNALMLGSAGYWADRLIENFDYRKTAFE